LRTFGALERIGNLVAARLHDEPTYGLMLAELAVAIAERITEPAYPAVLIHQIRGYAWKDFGNALRVLARYDESLEALRRAERYLEDHVALTHDLAQVRFGLATTLQEMQRYEESLALYAECREVFRRHSDGRRVVLSSFAEGVLFQRLRNYRQARETYLLLLASHREIDKETVAALHHAIGSCCVELGDYPEADANLLRAIPIYRELGMAVQIQQAEMMRGRLFLRQGDCELAVSHLRPVRRQFLRLSLIEEAGLCGLEIVETLLTMGSAGRVMMAESLARRIVEEFTSASLATRAITALGYLSEAIAARKATAALAKEVREFVLSLRTAPEREFSRLTATG
jgi:tetratricopeptide (TPR) repeat protein